MSNNSVAVARICKPLCIQKYVDFFVIGDSTLHFIKSILFVFIDYCYIIELFLVKNCPPFLAPYIIVLIPLELLA